MARRNQGAKLRYLEDRGAFYITWTVNGRSRKCSTGTSDSEAAQVFFANWLQGRGKRSGPSDPSEMLVTDALTAYAKEHGPEVIGKETMANAISALTSFWQGRTVADVIPQTCKHYVATRQPRSNGTTRRELGTLQAAINWQYRSGRLTRPVIVTFPEAPTGRKRWLTRQEAAALLRASRTKKARLYMPLFILIGIYTGRRKEAILSLRWPQVDLKAKLIDFELPGRDTTNKRRGAVPIPDRLLPHLIRARRRGSDLGHVVHDHGKRIKNTKKGFEAACRRAGLGDVTPHSMRHTAATWLMQRGVKTWEAAGFLAMTEKTLINTYGHHHPDYMRAAAEAIGTKPKGMARYGA